MTIIQTGDLSPTSQLPPDIHHQVYCGLDNCLTFEIRQQLEPLLAASKNSQIIYSFERALQAPYLEIMQRGFAVDRRARNEAAASLRHQIEQLSSILQELTIAVAGKVVNPRSPSQLKSFFYDSMRFPEIWISIKGERHLSTNREVLEKLYDKYLYARPFVSCILSIRDLSKQLEVFDTEIDSDGRFRTSYNIAGTETGRPSSSSNAFGTGGNAQNIAPALRYVFIPDNGYKLCVIDYEQVEARDVGWFCGCLFNDWTYLDACESGDLHTTNSKRIWPELRWVGDVRGDRAIADQIFYRDFSYRDMAKRGSHLSNYMGTAWTAARALKVPQQIMEDFQSRYCRGSDAAYPCIPRWWQWTAQQLQTTHQLTTPFGRLRHFFGRPGDDTTLREAIAFLPQSTTADRTNLGLWRNWKYNRRVQLLAQTYDSITFQYREDDDEVSIIEQALDLLKVEFQHPSGRRYIVPSEAKVGYNWGNRVTKEDIDRAIKDGKNPPKLNERGLSKWTPSTTRVKNQNSVIAI